jgi:plastocyanin domain-containing protein
MKTLLAVLALALTSLACKEQAPATTPDGVPIREIAVTDRGYEPSRLDVAAGKPLVLRVTRKSPGSCGEALLVEGDPVEHKLPLNTPMDIKVAPPKAGELAFTCGMKMMRGVLVAR